MYSLDVNFLKDREIRPVETVAAARPAVVGDRRPLYYGLAVAIAALGLVGAYWLLLQQQMRTLRAREAELDPQIAELRQELAAIEQVREQIKLVEAENAAFTNVFDQIRPWSALLQELRSRTPVRVQLVRVSQTAGNTPADDPEAVPPLEGGIELDGIACSFDDVNDYLLVLQRSPLLQSDSVAIASAERPDSLDANATSNNVPLVTNPAIQGTCPGTPDQTPEILVEFQIQANLTPTPSSDLLEVLDRQGAVGLASRIRALRSLTETQE